VGNGSARFLRYVTDFQQEVLPPTGNPAMRQLDDLVRAARADVDDD